MWIEIVILLPLAFLQNTAFSLVSRARNRDHMGYHAFASVLSNGIWLATVGMFITTNMALYLVPSYIIGTVLGSLFGAKLSMRIEEWLGAKT